MVQPVSSLAPSSLPASSLAPVLLLLLLGAAPGWAITCPGFPGYCSENFPGNFCNVVCDRGRANVPLCQEDGTWTDIPRCIEHEPGVEEQIPGLCPGIPGYCATGFLHRQCKFDCSYGPDVDSICTTDGTWAPYPTCQGDLRETQDGCDGCPGPRGGARNRTAEDIVSSNTVSDRRIPKIITGNDGGRKFVPSFAGNINIGPVDVEDKPAASPTTAKVWWSPPATTTTPSLRPTTRRSAIVRKPVQSTFRQQQPAPLVSTRPPVTPAPAPAPTLSLFDRLKARANGGAAQPAPQRPAQPAQRSRPAQAPSPPRPSPTLQSSSGSTFGVFDEVRLPVPGQRRQSQASFPAVPRRRNSAPQPYGSQKSYGEFQTINLQ